MICGLLKKVQKKCRLTLNSVFRWIVSKTSCKIGTLIIFYQTLASFVEQLERVSKLCKSSNFLFK